MSQSSQCDIVNPDVTEENKFSSLMKEFKLFCDDQTNIKRKADDFLNNCQETLHNQVLSDFRLSAFSLIFEQFKVLFNSILCRVSKSVEQEEKFDITFLQNAFHIIEIVTGTFDHMIQSLANQQALNAIYDDCSITVSTVDIIHQSYEHCKLSRKIYGTSFAHAASSLGDLFRKTFALQKVFAIVLNKAEISDVSGLNKKGRDRYHEVCQHLLDICSIVGDMDTSVDTLLGSTWKLLLSFLLKCKSILEGGIDLTPYIEQLVYHGTNYAQRCTSMTGNTMKGDAELIKTVAVNARMSSFFNGVLINILAEYSSCATENLATVVEKYMFSVLQIMKPFLLVAKDPNENYPPALQKVFSCHFMKEIDKSLLYLLSSQPFQCRLFNNDSTATETFPQLILLLRLIKLCGSSTSHLDLLFGGRRGVDDDHPCVFTTIFRLVDLAYPDFMLSTDVYLDEQPSSLYETIASHLCAAVVGVPPARFHSLECILLNTVINGGPYAYLLASDAWCFLARFSSADLCCHHVKVLATIVHSFKVVGLTARQSRVGALLNRLFVFLLPEHQTALLNTYPINDPENVIIWYFLGSEFFKIGKDSRMLSELCNKIIESTSDWVKKGGLVSGVPTVVTHLRMADNTLKGMFNENNFNNMSKRDIQILSSVGLCLVGVWENLSSNSTASNALLALSADLALVTSRLIGSLIAENGVLSILVSANKLLTSQKTVPKKLLFTFAKLLTALRHFVLPQDTLTEMISLWQKVLSRCSDSDWLLRHSCLDEFERFSRATKQPQAVPRICAPLPDRDHASHNLGNIVKSHLKRDIVALEEGTTIFDVLAAQQSKLVAEPFEVPSETNHHVSELNCIISDIRKSVEMLRCIPAKSFTQDQKASLKETLHKLQSILSEE